MDVVSYTHFRNNLTAMLDKVNQDHAPIMITRRGGEPAILISAKDFGSYEETAYLMASPANAKELMESIAQIEAGLAKPRELIDVDGDE